MNQNSERSLQEVMEIVQNAILSPDDKTVPLDILYISMFLFYRDSATQTFREYLQKATNIEVVTGFPPCIFYIPQKCDRCNQFTKLVYPTPKMDQNIKNGEITLNAEEFANVNNGIMRTELAKCFNWGHKKPAIMSIQDWCPIICSSCLFDVADRMLWNSRDTLKYMIMDCKTVLSLYLITEKKESVKVKISVL